MANWTRGVGDVSGSARPAPSESHTIEVGDAISVNYLNIQQSPIPWANRG